MNIYYYKAEDDKDRYRFHSYFDLNCALLEDIAEDYFNRHQGDDANWPLVFEVWDDKENHLGAWFVDMEMVPRFYASKQ